MPEQRDTPTTISEAQLRAHYEARARAELADADSLVPGADVIKWRGALFARVAVVKGLPGPAEAAGGAALSGADGEALGKALVALGWDLSDVFYTLSRPVAGADAAGASARVRLQLEAVDPEMIIALDEVAAADVAAAFGLDALKPGASVRVLGRKLVALTAFEATLMDEAAKRRAWAQLKPASPAGPVY